MNLDKYRIGSLIQKVDEKNNLGIRDFYGVNIDKKFMPTFANTTNLDEKKYKLIKKNQFIYSGMQTGRDKTIRISMYTEEVPVIVSPAYTTFEVIREDVIIPTYLFMIFQSSEKDRLGWFLSDSSVRANLDWEIFCDIELDLPPLRVQKKYVEIYNALIYNQNTYRKRLDDLVKVSEMELDKVKKEAPRISVGDLLEEVDTRNRNGDIKDVRGINITKNFMPSNASVNENSIKNYKIVEKGQFAYSSMQTGRDKSIRIALLKEDNPIVVSPAYKVLRTKTNEVLAEYIMMWFTRGETDRFGWFASDSSIRANLDLNRFYEFQIPVPHKQLQRGIVNIYNLSLERRNIVNRIDDLINSMSPVLIKGSLEEATK